MTGMKQKRRHTHTQSSFWVAPDGQSGGWGLGRKARSVLEQAEFFLFREWKRESERWYGGSRRRVVLHWAILRNLFFFFLEQTIRCLVDCSVWRRISVHTYKFKRLHFRILYGTNSWRQWLVMRIRRQHCAMAVLNMLSNLCLSTWVPRYLGSRWSTFITFSLRCTGPLNWIKFGPPIKCPGVVPKINWYVLKYQALGLSILLSVFWIEQYGVYQYYCYMRCLL